MTDKLFTKRLRDLTDEAIRESLAEIGIEFEKRFGPAALTASPPVVEEGVTIHDCSCPPGLDVICDIPACPRREASPVVEREAIDRVARALSDASDNGLASQRFERGDNLGGYQALAHAAILALTPVEGVGEREARTEYGWLIERDGHGGLRYATPRSWTADHMQALRFARKVDAEEFAASRQDWSTDIRITEHAWD